MQSAIRGVHFSVKDSLREHIETKLEKVGYAKEYIVDLSISLKREACQFSDDAHLHFRWGNATHLTASGHDVEVMTDQLLDKVFAAVRKEKERLKTSHSRPGPIAESDR